MLPLRPDGHFDVFISFYSKYRYYRSLPHGISKLYLKIRSFPKTPLKYCNKGLCTSAFDSLTLLKECTVIVMILILDFSTGLSTLRSPESEKIVFKKMCAKVQTKIQFDI